MVGPDEPTHSAHQGSWGLLIRMVIVVMVIMVAVEVTVVVVAVVVRRC
jgi:heme/copper-type cytochrome/quinol oxidase subunit 2